MSAIDSALLNLAARNIAHQVASAPGRPTLVVCSKDKEQLARMIAREIETGGGECHVLRLGRQIDLARRPLRALVRETAREGALVLLLAPEHASFLFDVVGRPDHGLKVPPERLLCDWLIRPASLLRTYAIDLQELQGFRRALLSSLAGAQRIRIVSEAGTDISLHPRSWQASHGEVFTAPDESYTNGLIYVDGCAYGGPPVTPFALRVENGRVTNLDELDASDEQQRRVKKDLTRDTGASVLAELGIGTNLGARWDEYIMEAEQARGTCHLGFGHNVAYGGRNASTYHFDLVIRRPTVEVDDRRICHAGNFDF